MDRRLTKTWKWTPKFVWYAIFGYKLLTSSSICIMIKEAVYVGNSDFRFINENLRILGYFLLKVLEKSAKFQFIFHKNRLCH